MRIIFMGTPDFAVPSLTALARANHEIACVYTQPPRPGGRRGKQLTKTPVHVEAERLGIEVRHPASLKGAEAQAEFAALEAELAVVAAYGLILPQPILDAPTRGCINVHASILPRWRGAAPIQRAILAGDEGTGITLMQMEAGLDTGPMLATVRTQVDAKTAGELTDELAQLGAQLLVGQLEDLDALRPIAQDDEEATYAAKIDKAEARIDWGADAATVLRQVRAFAPAPGAWFMLGEDRVKLHTAELAEGTGAPGEILDQTMTIACGTGAIRPLRLQKAGKPAMVVGEFLRGNAAGPGTRLS
ncbi:methionyl-tRNA formyltransferase [Alteriqipengyuania flavescens]|uniref:methionyl-tRNA formyltransferase n=1 Tax=Alteriqipengyuania flavescens TaxID=3053610 RepID=UPI0025B37BFA|nr:methionyl-tRNA formyltransferase [Alteriqipengyuania flavescens]WJY18882.1 methionyl-tRNA formyltransferase [Alteriqipengyuania flavescens]WJY24822.1 methionyl-tRNA formyltransferase [Alteriqipengyuania flavescens]